MERAAWTEERLDDLAEAMRSGFARVDTDIRDLRVELREGLGGVRSEIAAVRDEIGALKTMLLRASVAGMIGVLSLLVAVIARGA